MALLSIAIVGKTNEPIYLKEVYKDEEGDDIEEGELFGLSFSTGSSRSQNKGSGGFNCGLKQQFILHAALDRFDQLAGPPPGFGWRDPAASGPDAMFVGCLCPVEESRVYGYMSQTKIKFLAVVEDDAIPGQTSVSNPRRDFEIKRLLIDVHRLYVEYTLNPFNQMGDHMILSPKFDDAVSDTIDLFNNLVRRQA